MRILLVRHGESTANADPVVHTTTADHATPLSDGGMAQARRAGEFLAHHLDGLPTDSWTEPGSDVLYSGQPEFRLWLSPYRRTRETADEIQGKLGYRVLDRREHILLCEQQFGLFDGIPDDQLPILFPNEHNHYDKCQKFGGRFWARMPLGESRFDVATRVHQAFGTFHRDAEKHGIRNLIIVAHGVTIRAFVMMWCHKTPEWFEDEPNPNNCSVREIVDNEDRGYIFPGFPRAAR